MSWASRRPPKASSRRFCPPDRLWWQREVYFRGLTGVCSFRKTDGGRHLDPAYDSSGQQNCRRMRHEVR